MREEERRQNLNKRTGLRSMESLFGGDSEGEMYEMGGAQDPLRGAMTYQRSTQIKNVGSQRRVKKIVEETSWMGGGGLGQHRKKMVCLYNNKLYMYL